jgi:hypothetical protein
MGRHGAPRSYHPRPERAGPWPSIGAVDAMEGPPTDRPGEVRLASARSGPTTPPKASPGAPSPASVRPATHRGGRAAWIWDRSASGAAAWA